MEPKAFSLLKTRRDFIRQAACAALGTVALNTAIRDLRFINAAMAQTPVNDYKALVCVFLSGGNDSNNLIIPTAPDQYQYYSTIRTPVLAIPRAALLDIVSANPDGHTYGLHPNCPELQTLFGEGKLALLFNTGTLLYPLTRSQYYSSSYKKPPQLFSHSDQVTQWQTSIPDQPALTGWGGRCADLLNAVQPDAKVSLSISVAGANTFEVGNMVSEYSVSTAGAIALTGLSTNSAARLRAVTNIMNLTYPNLQAQAYSKVAAHAIGTADVLNTAIAPTAAAGYWTTPFPATTLGSQLRMVARLIAARSALNMKRQIFFCSVGGYDTHTNQTAVGDASIGAHANLLGEVSKSLLAFQRAIEQLGIPNSVTAFTGSDFGRTFPANGQGSDHGWGSHHLIVGGAVAGGRTYGKFPNQTINGPEDTSTGRWIPSTAIDQYCATLAAWFGVTNTDLYTVFPNLARFASANLGFMS